MKGFTINITLKEQDLDKDEVTKYRVRLFEMLDQHIKEGTYDIERAALAEEPFVGEVPRYATVRELNDALSTLARRTLDVMNGLGIGRRSALWAAWNELAHEGGLDERIEPKIVELSENLEALKDLTSLAEDGFRETQSSADSAVTELVNLRDKIESYVRKQPKR